MKIKHRVKPLRPELSNFPIERSGMVESSSLEKTVMEILTNANKEIMKRVLSLGEISLPQPQFKAFRKEIFDLFGSRELRRVAHEIVSEHLGSDCDGFGQGRRTSH
jgi:hypothetical protein